MWGIGLEWWILYGMLLILLFFVCWIWGILHGIAIIDKRLELLFRGEDILHADLEEIKRILERT